MIFTKSGASDYSNVMYSCVRHERLEEKNTEVPTMLRLLDLEKLLMRISLPITVRTVSNTLHRLKRTLPHWGTSATSSVEG